MIGARDGNLAVAVFVDIDVVAAVVKVDREDVSRIYRKDGHVAVEKRTLLQKFQGGHPAASLALPGPVVVVVVSELLKTGALREEA
jgi:hypothetical protein